MNENIHRIAPKYRTGDIVWGHGVKNEGEDLLGIGPCMSEIKSATFRPGLQQWLYETVSSRISFLEKDISGKL